MEGFYKKFTQDQAVAWPTAPLALHMRWRLCSLGSNLQVTLALHMRWRLCSLGSNLQVA